MSPPSEEFDWNFVGAVVIISLACFAFIISVSYYCWLYEIVTSLKHLMTSLLGQNRGSTGSSKLPVSVRDQAHNTVHSSHCEDGYCHVALQPHPSSSTQKPFVLKKLPGGRGLRRPRQTRQRAVNVALYDLKYHNQRVPPAKPVKSEVVKAYIKSTGASTSSEADSFSSTTITDNISSDSDKVVMAGVTCTARGNVVVTSERLTDKEHQSRAPIRSYRSKKWSKIKTKQRAKEASLAKVTELVHKLGRSTRAVAPHTLTPSEQFRMAPCVRRAMKGNDIGLKKDRIKPDSIFEALLALRKSGDLGLNLISNPVSKSFKLKSKTNDISDNKTMVKPSDRLKEQYEDSSGSDDVKSSSDSSSLIIMSSSINKQPSTDPHQLNDLNINPHYYGDTEGDKQSSKKNINVMDDSNKTFDNQTVPPNIDPSKQVFGGENNNIHLQDQLDKSEGPVRRIDSLFCSTTPSSIGSCVSEQVFEAQIEHNNSERKPDHKKRDQQMRSAEDNLDVIDDYKRETITSNTTTQSRSRDRGSKDVESASSSSFNSTTLPTVSSESVSTIEISSEEGNTGKLKYFEDLR